MREVELFIDESIGADNNAFAGYSIAEHFETVEDHLEVFDKQLEPFGLEIEKMDTEATFTAYRIVTKK